jgi:hypothetical protein
MTEEQRVELQLKALIDNLKGFVEQQKKTRGSM